MVFTHPKTMAASSSVFPSVISAASFVLRLLLSAPNAATNTNSPTPHGLCFFLTVILTCYAAKIIGKKYKKGPDAGDLSLRFAWDSAHWKLNISKCVRGWC